MKVQQEYQKEFQNYDTWMVLLDKNSNYTQALQAINKLSLVQNVLNPATMLDQAIPRKCYLLQYLALSPMTNTFMPL